MRSLFNYFLKLIKQFLYFGSYRVSQGVLLPVSCGMFHPYFRRFLDILSSIVLMSNRTIPTNRGNEPKMYGEILKIVRRAQKLTSIIQ